MKATSVWFHSSERSTEFGSTVFAVSPGFPGWITFGSSLPPLASLLVRLGAAGAQPQPTTPSRTVVTVAARSRRTAVLGSVGTISALPE